jgi:hypothetical protein
MASSERTMSHGQNPAAPRAGARSQRTTRSRTSGQTSGAEPHVKGGEVGSPPPLSSPIGRSRIVGPRNAELAGLAERAEDFVRGDVHEANDVSAHDVCPHELTRAIDGPVHVRLDGEVYEGTGRVATQHAGDIVRGRYVEAFEGEVLQRDDIPGRVEVCPRTSFCRLPPWPGPRGRDAASGHSR